ncbi:M15 family metallopeptidase [Nonomuraea sp. NPDC050663]|uniref:M15 family metallopeptidase n=1 Tax=Nonomuraea sp. NPDC050663 TaxID=3364370 RepID=UPI0037BAAFB1
MAVSKIVLLIDARISAIPVVDCDEPLMDLRDAAELHLDDRQADPDRAYAKVRLGTLTRLRTAQRALPTGYRLVVVEGYRPPQLQRRYFNEYVALLAKRHPEWSEERLTEAASEYISPPEVAPHSTGGAVDITLRGPDGHLCWMGTEVNTSPADSDGACYTDATNISSGSRANRDILSQALITAGFVNYPTEWWHWSIGDRYWAFCTGAAIAYYGPLPEVPNTRSFH